MARPLKDGVDYFPLNVSMDEKFDLIEAEFGLTGFAVIVKLYQRVYSRGYYCEWTEEVALLFSRGVWLGGNVVSEIVSAAIKRGIFDKNMFDKYQILTSKGIQERYFEAVGRRKCVNVNKAYLLIDIAKILPIANINWINDNNNPENVDDNSQRKGNKMKGNKRRKDDDMSEPAKATPDRQHFISLLLNDKSEYPVFQEQVDSWSELYPAVNVPQELRKMKGWCDANPSKRKTRRGILRFINNWLSGEQDKGGNRNGKGNGQRSGDAAEVPEGESLGIQL